MLLFVRNYHKLTRVDWSTLQRRGKSFTPSSSISIEDSSNCREARREETEADSADAIVNAGSTLLNCVFGCLLSLPTALLDTRDVSRVQTVKNKRLSRDSSSTKRSETPTSTSTHQFPSPKTSYRHPTRTTPDRTSFRLHSLQSRCLFSQRSSRPSLVRTSALSSQTMSFPDVANTSTSQTNCSILRRRYVLK